MHVNVHLLVMFIPVPNLDRIFMGDNSWELWSTPYWFCWGHSRGGIRPWMLGWWAEGHHSARIYHTRWEIPRETAFFGGWTFQNTKVTHFVSPYEKHIEITDVFVVVILVNDVFFFYFVYAKCTVLTWNICSVGLQSRHSWWLERWGSFLFYC